MVESVLNKHVNPVQQTETPVEFNPSFGGGKTLAQVFDKDVLKHSTVAQKEKELTWWQRIVQFFTGTQAVKTELQTANEATATAKLQPIDRIPTLEAPEPLANQPYVDEMLQGKHPFSFKDTPKNDGIKEADKTSEKEDDMLTMEQLLFKVMKGRIQMREERGIIASATSEKFHDISKATRERLQDLQDQISKEEKASYYFGWAQTIAGYAALTCAVAGIVVSCGVTLPAALALAVAIGTPVAGLSTGLATGGKTYFDYRKDQHQADATDRQHTRDVLKEAATQHQDKLAESIEEASQIQGRLIQLAHKKAQLVETVLQRS